MVDRKGKNRYGKFSHLDKKGKAKMVDVSTKLITKREAVACGIVLVQPKIIDLIQDKQIPKGDVLTTAKIAGILAAKKTHSLIPMCHPLPIEYIEIDFKLYSDKIIVTSYVKTSAKTGVEMEALVAASIAALTIYDMCKSIDKGIIISQIKLLKKTGGKSGTYLKKSDKV